MIAPNAEFPVALPTIAPVAPPAAVPIAAPFCVLLSEAHPPKITTISSKMMGPLC